MSMKNVDKAAEQSMEDILSSIRRIVTDEPTADALITPAPIASAATATSSKSSDVSTRSRLNPHSSDPANSALANSAPDSLDALLDLVEPTPTPKPRRDDTALAGAQKSTLTPSNKQLAKAPSKVIQDDFDDLLEPLPNAPSRTHETPAAAPSSAASHPIISLPSDSYVPPVMDKRLEQALGIHQYSKSAVVPNSLIPLGGAFQGMPRTAASRPTWQFARPEAAMASIGVAPPLPKPTPAPIVAPAAVVAASQAVTEPKVVIKTELAAPVATPIVANKAQAQADDTRSPKADVPTEIVAPTADRTGIAALTSALAALPFATSAKDVPAVQVADLAASETTSIDVSQDLDLASALSDLDTLADEPTPADLSTKRPDPEAGAVEAKATDTALAHSADAMHPVASKNDEPGRVIEPMAPTVASAEVIAAPTEGDDRSEAKSTSVTVPEPTSATDAFSSLKLDTLTDAKLIEAGTSVELAPDASDTTAAPVIASPPSFEALRSLARTVESNAETAPAPAPPSWALARSAGRVASPDAPGVSSESSLVASLAAMEALFPGVKKTSATVVQTEHVVSTAPMALPVAEPLVDPIETAPEVEVAAQAVVAVDITAATLAAEAPEVDATIETVSDATTTAVAVDHINAVIGTEAEGSHGALAVAPPTEREAVDETVATEVPLNELASGLAAITAPDQVSVQDSAPDTGTDNGSSANALAATTLAAAAIGTVGYLRMPAQPQAPTVPGVTEDARPSTTLPVDVPVLVPVDVPVVAAAAEPASSVAAPVTVPATPPQAVAGPNSGSRSLEDAVVDLLRPMLRSWIDANMPVMVEKALRAETSVMATPLIPTTAPTQKPN
jgi:uncharacterized protein